MYEMSDDRRRPGGHGLGQGALPVLFHLQDVSRPRAMPAPPSPKPAPAETSVEAAAGPSVEVPMAAAASLPSLAVETPTDDFCDPISPPTLSSPFSGPAAIPLEGLSNSAAAPSTDILTLHAPGESKPSPSSINTLEITEFLPAEPPAPTPSAPPPVTLASPPTSRRRAKTAASEDWFASHGKFIAIAFVLALIGTIYFARTNRRQADRVAAAPPVPASAAVSSSSHDSPAKAVSLTVDAKVELHPPEAPQLASAGSAGDRSKGNDNLFVFPSSKSAEERVASRAEGASTPNSTPSQQPPPSNQAGVTAPAATSSNAPSAYPPAAPPPQGYPITSAPPLMSPTPPGRAAPPPPQAPPGTGQSSTNPPPNYRSQFPMPGEPSAPLTQGWAPPGPGYDSPGSSQPWNNTVRGPRYERTGSGNQ